jgi:hypothetical protein
MVRPADSGSKMSESKTAIRSAHHDAEAQGHLAISVATNSTDGQHG